MSESHATQQASIQLFLFLGCREWLWWLHVNLTQLWYTWMDRNQIDGNAICEVPPTFAETDNARRFEPFPVSHVLRFSGCWPKRWESYIRCISNFIPQNFFFQTKRFLSFTFVLVLFCFCSNSQSVNCRIVRFLRPLTLELPEGPCQGEK